MITPDPKLKDILPIIEKRSDRMCACLNQAVEVARPDGLLESNHLLYAALEALEIEPQILYKWGLNPDNVLDEITYFRRGATQFYGEPPFHGEFQEIKVGMRLPQLLAAAAEWANLQGVLAAPEHLLVAILLGSPTKGGKLTIGSMADPILALNDLDFNRDAGRAREFAALVLPDLAAVIEKK